MVFNTGAALLDAVVLAAVSREEDGTYGYKDSCLETYDVECGGRNRRYYKITETGENQLNIYKQEWKIYSSKISAMFSGEEIV